MRNFIALLFFTAALLAPSLRAAESNRGLCRLTSRGGSAKNLRPGGSNSGLAGLRFRRRSAQSPMRISKAATGCCSGIFFSARRSRFCFWPAGLSARIARFCRAHDPLQSHAGGALRDSLLSHRRLLSVAADGLPRYFREHTYGLATQTFGPWFGEQLIALALSLVGTSILLIALYAVFRRAPRTWWLWGTGGRASISRCLRF